MSGKSCFGRRAPVERSGRSPDYEPSCSRPLSGSKRSVQQRLGTKEGEGRREKRHKGVHSQESHLSNDAHLAKDDLRFELIKMRDQSAGLDLRLKLSSKSNLASADGNRSPLAENLRQDADHKSYNDKKASFSRNNMGETRDIDVDKRKNMQDTMPNVGGSSRGQYIRGIRERVRVPSLRAVGDPIGRQARAELRGVDKQNNMEDSMPDLGGSSSGQFMLDFGDRSRVQSLREVGDSVGRLGRADVVGLQSLGEHKDTYNSERPIVQRSRERYSGMERQNIHEPWDRYNGGDSNILDTRGDYDSGRQKTLQSTSLRMESDYNIPKQRSPVRMLSSTFVRASSPDRNIEQQTETIRRYDDDRLHLYRRREVPGPYTPVGSPVNTRQIPLNALPPLTAAPMLFSAQLPQPSLRNQNLIGEPLIEAFLRSVGLEKYSNHFRQEEVDYHALAQMTDNDLKELKIPMGPRKRILQALLPPPPPRR